MGTIVRLILLCLVVGLLLAFFDITPHSILTDTARTIREVWDLIGAFVRWALPYILLGAVIVVPIALLSFLLRRARR
jgi:hypothetical protein